MALLIDTSVLVELERKRLPLSALQPVVGEEPLLLCAVVAAELLAGVEGADDEPRRVRRAAFVERLLDNLPVLPFDLGCARVHARVAGTLRAAGQSIGAHDLLIAATALGHDLGVLTANTGEFARVPGLRVVPVP